jgi:hypothetical protein
MTGTDFRFFVPACVPHAPSILGLVRQTMRLQTSVACEVCLQWAQGQVAKATVNRHGFRAALIRAAPAG